MKRFSFIAVVLLAFGLSLVPAPAYASTSRDLLNQANVTVEGAAAGDNTGDSVAGAGDVNGDGLADVIVGAPAADNNSRTDSGSS